MRGASGFVQGDFDEANRILYLLGFASVYKIHMDTNTLLGILDVKDVYQPLSIRGSLPTGLAGIALNPSKDRLYIVSGDAHMLYSYDIAKSAWTTKITNLKGYFPTDAIISPDRRYFYTANNETGNITMFDLTTGDIVRTIDLN